VVEDEIGAIAERLAAVIRHARQDARRSQAQLAATLGVEQTRLSRWELAKSVPNVIEVAALEAALGLPRGDLLTRAGLVATDRRDTEQAISADPHLSDQSRSLLLRFYRTAAEMDRRERLVKGIRRSQRARRSTGRSDDGAPSSPSP
jgi:transcriptional regulator with XRE-family HTH domain